MAGLNISEYLSYTTGSQMPGNNNVSTLFNSLSNKPTTNLLSQNVDPMSSMLTDYASMKSGSYYKLMKKYYSGDTQKASKEDIEAYQKKQDLTANKAAALSSTIDDLMDSKYTEDNKSGITDKVKKFVDEYNSLLKNSDNSDLSSINQKSEWMANMVKEYSSVLSQVGIDVSAKGELSVNSEQLDKAKIDSLKDVFGAGVNSFSNKVLYKAEQIYSLAKTYGGSATAYTSNGAYHRDYSSNYDTTT